MMSRDDGMHNQEKKM